MNCKVLLLRLILAMVLWSVIGTVIFLLFSGVFSLLQCQCGLEWIALATLFALHLLSAATGPILWKVIR